MSKVGIAHERVNDFFNTSHKEWLADAGVDWHPVDLSQHKRREDTEILVTGSLTAEQMNDLPNLKAVIVPFSGINWLDVEALTAKGVRIFNTTVHSKFVAERAMLLTLAVMGKLMDFHKGLEQGLWSGRVEKQMIPWTTLFDKKVAIYGYGNVGRDLHQLLKPFSCQIGILNYKDRKYEGVELFNNLDELSNWCDVLIVTAPLTNLTRGSIDSSIMSNLDGKILVNVGRGEIVDEKALYDSLVSDNLGGFGSDVWYKYPSEEIPVCQPSIFPISSFSQVVMTPHNGGFEVKADDVKYMDVADQIKSILAEDYSRQIKL